MRKTKKHVSYSIKEINQIVMLYLDQHMKMMDIIRRYDIGSKFQVYRWVKQYQSYGTVIDNRGKATKAYYQVIDMLREQYPVKLLCRTLGCSRSGYYAWIKLGRPTHKAFNETINRMVKEMYEKDERRGIRTIRMYIQRKTFI